MKNKRTLLCATDSGGIRNLATLIPELQIRGYSCAVITDRTKSDLWGGALNELRETFFINDIHLSDLASIITLTDYSTLINGTTIYDSPDRRLTNLTRNLGIQTTTILDEWYYYKYRFEDLITGNLILPDRIALQDEKAKIEAINEGIPPKICFVTGSPYLANLTDKAQDFVKNPPLFPRFLIDTENIPVIAFISETHAADYGSKPGEKGILGPFIGYTEKIVRDQIIDVLEDLDQPIVFVEKLHPSSSTKNSKQEISHNIAWYTVREIDLWSLLYHSELVIGMRSMALLEARILGCKTISFQPGLIGPDLCTAVKLGLIPKAEDSADLKIWIKENLKSGTHYRTRKIIRFDFAPTNAIQNVVKLALRGVA